MFRRFNRLVPILNFKHETLSLYGEIMSYTFYNKKIKNPKEIPPKEKWETRDFKIKNIDEVKSNKKISSENQCKIKDLDIKDVVEYNKKIPYKDQWETKDFYVPNKRYDIVVLNDKTITYQDYIQQLFLLDKENREKKYVYKNK